jgi:transcriptional regulator GlxA family with amidase domain
MNDHFGIIFAMRIHVLALDGVFDLGLSAVIDAFHTANELAEMSSFSGERFEVRIVGVTKSVKTSQGLTVPVRRVAQGRPTAWWFQRLGSRCPSP